MVSASSSALTTMRPPAYLTGVAHQVAQGVGQAFLSRSAAKPVGQPGGVDADVEAPARGRMASTSSSQPARLRWE